MDVIMDPVSMVVSIGVKEIYIKIICSSFYFYRQFLSKKKMYFFIVIVKILKFKI